LRTQKSGKGVSRSKIEEPLRETHSAGVQPETVVPSDCKATHISVADAWISATAKVHHLTLLHKDPEFEPLKEDLELMELPYKRK